MDKPILRIQLFQTLEKVTNKEPCKRLAIQPFTVGIMNCDDRLIKYRGETFKGTYSVTPKSKIINHAGLLVGRGIDSKGIRYWKIRCAFGEEWGIFTSRFHHGNHSKGKRHFLCYKLLYFCISWIIFCLILLKSWGVERYIYYRTHV